MFPTKARGISTHADASRGGERRYECSIMCAIEGNARYSSKK